MLDELEQSNKGRKFVDLDCSCSSYVDDVAVMANLLRNLQMLVNIAYTHSYKYRYEFHADKSSVVIFGKSQRTIQQSSTVEIGSKTIPQRHSNLHLGVRQESIDHCHRQ